MKKQFFKRCLIAACALLLFMLTACSNANVLSVKDSASRYRSSYVAPKPAAAPKDPETYDGYQEVAANANLKLFYNEEEDTIEVRNLLSSTVWSSAVDWSSYGLDTPNPMQAAITGSLFAIVYTDTVSNEGQLSTVYSKNEPSTRSMSYIENGIALKYQFSLLQMTIVLHITLDEDGLVLSFPSDQIQEKDRYLLMSLRLLPSFGASNHQDEGYILYPDGCGTLLRYENYKDRPKNPSNLSLDIYSSFSSDIEDYYTTSNLLEKQIEIPSSNSVPFPLFGIKKGDDAFLAYITLGDAQSSICVCPEGYMVNFNRAFFEFHYRNTFEIITSNISAGTNTNKKTALKVDKARMNQDYSVTYQFLSGDNANYSGMARTYREYLQKQNLLSSSADDTIALALDLFCGVSEKQMLTQKFIPMTTFEQAQDISEQLLASGVSMQSITLKGWAKNGYGTFPTPSTVATQLGGNRGLETLAKYAQDNNIVLFANLNPILAVSGNAGFSIRNDAVYTGNLLTFSDDTNTYYLLTPQSVIRNTLKINTQLNSIGNIGLSLEGLSRYVYENYETNAFTMRTDTAASWHDLLASLDGLVSSEGGNQYMLAYADRLYNIPITSSSTNLSDEDVPFLQMIIHGSIPYSSNAYNLFYDNELQKLQWIEYGCMPYFELTAERTSSLKYTNYNHLYTSYYGDWLDDAVSLYEEFNATLSGTWNSSIEQHTRLSKNLVKIVYQSGKTVYVNYSENSVTADGYDIPAKDYLVIG